MHHEPGAVDRRHELLLYRWMSRLPLGSRFANKVFLIAFLGTHVPLLTLVVYFFWSAGGLSTHLDVLLVALLATLAGFVGSLLLLRALLAPISLTASSLNEYRSSGTPPDLPTHYRDEVGSLMATVQQTIERLDALFGALHEAANTDELTGALNRRAAQKQLGSLIERNRHQGLAVHVAAIDLDRFKPVNDEFGHPAGDRLLRAFGVELAKHLRPSDWLARIGGDEFLVAMTNCTRLEMAERMNRIQRLVHAQSFEIHEDVWANVRFSFGISAVGPDDDLDAVLERADAALYDQKAKRR